MTEPAAAARPALSPGLRLGRHAGIHLVTWLAAFALFAAVDSWQTVTGLTIAATLCVPLGMLAGITTTTLIHEWFHLLGAWMSGGRYSIPAKAGLFVFEWDFEHNNLRQFYLMSVAGSVGGALSLAWLWTSLPTDTAGRCALLAGAIFSFIFGAVIEWPVLKRCRSSGDPMAELSLIDQKVLVKSLIVAATGGIFGFIVLY